MKRIISIIIVISLVIIPCCFIVSADDIEADTSIVVIQSNSSYAGWSNTSPTHYGFLSSGSSRYPISLASTRSTTSVLEGSTYSPTTVEVYVSNPNITGGGYIYLCMWNGYGNFIGQDNIDTIFNFDNSIPGYIPRYSSSSGLGYTNGGGFNLTAPSSFSVATDVMRTGTSYSVRSGTATVVATININNPVPNSNGTGSVLVQPYYKSYSQCRILSYTIPSGPYLNASTTTVRFTFDANDLAKCQLLAGATNSYLHSAIFVPLCVYVPATTQDVSILLNNIITKLTSIVTYESGISLNVDMIVDALQSGDVTVITALSDIMDSISNIESGLVAVTGNQYDSAIQYIEYYLNAVLGNTNTMVTQLNNITATLNQIANTIGAANTDAQDAVQNAEDVHDYEQEIFSQANIDIGSTVISSFNFDLDTASGLARAGIDFTNLWSAIRQWNVVYTFSMILTLAFTIIRFTRVSHRSKKSDKEQ